MLGGDLVVKTLRTEARRDAVRLAALMQERIPVCCREMLFQTKGPDPALRNACEGCDGALLSLLAGSNRVRLSLLLGPSACQCTPLVQEA